MIWHWLLRFEDVFPGLGAFRFITFRALCAALTAFLVELPGRRRRGEVRDSRCAAFQANAVSLRTIDASGRHPGDSESRPSSCRRWPQERGAGLRPARVLEPRFKAAALGDRGAQHAIPAARIGARPRRYAPA